MEKFLKILNTTLLVVIAVTLELIYLKIPKPLTRNEMIKIHQIKNSEEKRNAIYDLPYYRSEVINSVDVEVLNTVEVDGSIDCY